MREKTIKKVLNNSLFFSIGIFAGKAINMILLPVYTRFLSETEYGIASTITSFCSTFSIVVILSLRAALLRFYKEYDEKARREFVGTVIIVVVANSVLLCGGMLLLRKTISSWFFPGITFFPYIFLGVLALAFDAVYLLYQSILQSRQDGKRYTLVNILYMLLHVAFNLFYIVGLKLGATGMILGLLTANVVFSVWGIIDILRRRYASFRFSGNMARKALAYSLPLIPHNLATPLSNYAAKYILNISVSYAATGLYTIATQVNTILDMVQSAVHLAFRPWFNEQIENGVEGRKSIKEFALLAYTFFSIACVGIALFSQELIYVMTDTPYHEAWKVVPILAIGLNVTFVYYTHVLPIMYDIKASKYVFICSVSSCIINICVSAILIPLHGSYGAAGAYLVSKLYLSVITVIFSRRVRYVDFGLKTMVKQTAICLMFIVSGLLYSDWRNIVELDVINILIKLFVFSIAVMYFLLPYRNEILPFLKRLMKSKCL